MTKSDAIWMALFLFGSIGIVTLAFTTGDVFALY